ncbi:MAG: ABC transporter permease subunit [Chloroflexi bacterium]|nr:ABC transporter permease subunit [Chloroflexota bacterium]MCI0729631.1 ABC transporter permease subunit [Chloroflexota bacterium]
MMAETTLEQTKPKQSNNLSPGMHALRTFVIFVALFLVYAFAVQATEIDLETPLEPGRQAGFLRVVRLLADPAIFTRDAETGRLALSETTEITLDGIVETILMALMASTIGTILAVPVSFLAARNLMAGVSAPLAGVMAALVALPAGGWLVGWLARQMVTLSAQTSEQAVVGLGAFALAAGLLWAALRLGPPVLIDGRRSSGLMTLSLVRGLAALLLALFGLGLLAHLGLAAGAWLENALGPAGFLGNFVFVLADSLRLMLPALMALLGAVLAASFASRYAQEAVLSLSGLPVRLLTAGLAFLGTAVLIYGVGLALNWLYQFDTPENWTTRPALIGGAAAGVIGLVIAPKRPFPIGLFIYTLSRSVLNILRSIEPLIMGIVFVIWVSLGPFAGVMALTLHSIAALGKLFSEQIEGIAEGPVEAITATGANRLQTIAYAVIPQIVPPYIAFTLYRWDINVRMATIIGFIGGGGIGLVLNQHITRLQYREASVMMLAIAVVVSALDYVSSKVRSRII